MTPEIRARLVRLLGMLGSAHDGERANAAALADRLVRGLGLTWTDVVRPPSRQAASRRECDLADVEICLDEAALWSNKQLTFLQGLAAWLRHRGPLTPKQRAALNDMLKRVEARERRAA